MLYIYQHFRCIDLSFQLEDAEGQAAAGRGATIGTEAGNCDACAIRMRIDVIARRQLGLTRAAADAGARIRRAGRRGSGGGALCAAESRAVDCCDWHHAAQVCIRRMFLRRRPSCRTGVACSEPCQLRAMQQESQSDVRLLIVAGVALLWMAAVFGRLGLPATLPPQRILPARSASSSAPRDHAQARRDLRPQHASAGDERAGGIGVRGALGDCTTSIGGAAALRSAGHSAGRARNADSSRRDRLCGFRASCRRKKCKPIDALNLKGIYFQKENQRFYPKRDLAAHVLGFVDIDEKGLAESNTSCDTRSAARAKRSW